MSQVDGLLVGQQQQPTDRQTDRPRGMCADVVVPDADRRNLSKRRNRSNDEHVGVTSLKDRKQRAFQTVRGTSTQPTFEHVTTPHRGIRRV